jgi:signal transduction histidine kinase
MRTRIYLVVFLLVILLGVLFTGITYMATTNFYEASTQLLNKDVAAHIARFTSPYGKEGFDRQKADSVFYDAMVISPSAEVYFLDTSGRVIYFHGENPEIKSWQVPVEHIRRYILSGGRQHIDGPDPRDPDHPKIFSAAAVEGPSGPLGYIYVVLGSRQYRSVTQMLFNSRITPVVLGTVILALAVALLVTVLYIHRILLVDNINRLTASEKERRDFMVNISHDLRTPLAIARGYAETLVLKKDALSGEEQRSYAELVAGKIRQVEKMVDQLFELSKMESASFEAKREPFVFSEMVEEVIRAVGAGREIVCDNCRDGTWVEADVSMMERVVQNLVVNAVAYTPPAGRIGVGLKKEGSELVFWVANEGPALDADLVQWINSAETARPARPAQPPRPSQPPARPAIGLAIVKKILLLHRFSFAVSTDRAQNIFTVRMPVYKPD